MVVEKTVSFLHNQARVFNIFHIVFSIIILLASLKTVIKAIGVSNWALFALAGAEVIAVILFVFPKLTKGAGVALMIIFSIAIALSLATGVIAEQLHLIVYFICTYFIVVHGNSLGKSS